MPQPSMTKFDSNITPLFIESMNNNQKELNCILPSSATAMSPNSDFANIFSKCQSVAAHTMPNQNQQTNPILVKQIMDNGMIKLGNPKSLLNYQQLVNLKKYCAPTGDPKQQGNNPHLQSINQPTSPSLFYPTTNPDLNTSAQKMQNSTLSSHLNSP